MEQSPPAGLHTAPAVLYPLSLSLSSSLGHPHLANPPFIWTMNISGFHQESLQHSTTHRPGNRQDLTIQERPSTFGELKPDPGARAEPEEACPVCGDRVSGYHYGLLTCESCKGFFKRSVQNNKHYTCAERQSCPMDPAQRKRCPYCRFQKCLAVGMKREAVRADRMRGGRNQFGPLYRRDRQLKQQRGRYHQANTVSYRIKLEGPLTPLQTHEFHLRPGAFTSPLGSDPFYQPHALPSSISQPELMVLDCTLSRDRALTAPSLPCAGLYHASFHGFSKEKREMPYSYSAATLCSFSPPMLAPSYTHTHTPTSTPLSDLTPSPTLTSASDPPSSNTAFLSELLLGEPEELQICSRVLASLRREQASRGKHDRLNTFSIMCKMADQTLFGLVEWARNCALFKELKVEDQMVLLQSCWSELLVLDHLCRQVAYGRDGCIYLVTGQQIEVSTVLSQAGTMLSSLVSRAQDLVSKLRALYLDRQEFVCLKYLVLFNPDVKSVQDRRQVERTQESVNRALMNHTQDTHPGQSDKFGQLLLRLPEVRSISLQVEEYLYQRHLLGDLPCNSLLTEMLHAKHT